MSAAVSRERSWPSIVPEDVGLRHDRQGNKRKQDHGDQTDAEQEPADALTHMPRDRVPNTRRKRPPLYDARHGHHSTPENRGQPDYRVTSPILAETYRVIVARSTRSAPSFVEIGETSIFDRAGYSAFLSDSMALSPWMAHMVCRWAFPYSARPSEIKREGRGGARCHASEFMCRRLPCGHSKTHYCCCRRILKPFPISNPGFPG